MPGKHYRYCLHTTKNVCKWNEGLADILHDQTKKGRVNLQKAFRTTQRIGVERGLILPTTTGEYNRGKIHASIQSYYYKTLTKERLVHTEMSEDGITVNRKCDTKNGFASFIQHETDKTNNPSHQRVWGRIAAITFVFTTTADIR